MPQGHLVSRRDISAIASLAAGESRKCHLLMSEPSYSVLLMADLEGIAQRMGVRVEHRSSLRRGRWVSTITGTASYGFFQGLEPSNIGPRSPTSWVTPTTDTGGHHGGMRTRLMSGRRVF